MSLAKNAARFCSTAQNSLSVGCPSAKPPSSVRRARTNPILLDIGAVWCHWCHVMDRESYEDKDTAALINELFVPGKSGS